MTVAKHGVSTDSADRILIDAGAIYLGFIDADSPGTLLGATRGGNTFELVRTIRRMEVDGAKGPVKGMRRIEEVVATIRANMLELTAENLRRAIAGAIYSSGTTTITGEANGEGDGELKLLQLGMLLDDCEVIWDEGAPVTGVTTTADAPSHQRGTYGAKMVMTSAAEIGVLASRVVSIDGSKLTLYKQLNLRIKSSVAVAADQLQILISDEALCANPECTINIPALAAGVQYNLVIDHDFSADGISALTLISIGVKQVSDLGEFDLYIDDVRAAATQIEENSETIAVVDRGAQVRGTDYAMDYDSGIIQFATAPEDDKAVTATYKYVSGAAVIGGETTELDKYNIKDGAYIDNVVIVGTITGKTNPVIVKITNALCDAGLSLSLAPKDEAVPEITFTAHYVNTDLDTEPWSVEYPAS